MSDKRKINDRQMDILEVLTDNLPPLETFSNEFNRGMVEYTVNGTALGFNLFNDGNIAIQRIFLTKGTIFPIHVHQKEIELIIIYKGKGKYISTDNEQVFGIGECCIVPKGVSHSWEVLEDSWLVAITIPSAEGYPHD